MLTWDASGRGSVGRPPRTEEKKKEARSSPICGIGGSVVVATVLELVACRISRPPQFSPSICHQVVAESSQRANSAALWVVWRGKEGQKESRGLIWVARLTPGWGLENPINLQPLFSILFQTSPPSRESDEAIASTWEQAQAHGHSLGGARSQILKPW